MKLLDWLRGEKVYTPLALPDSNTNAVDEHNLIQALATVVAGVGGRLEVEPATVRAIRGQRILLTYTEAGTMVIEVVTEQQFQQRMADLKLPRN